MVFHKELDYGLNGHRAPAMPRIPRSAKGKRSARRKVEDNQMYAFDLLAAVAGKILLEKENPLKPSDFNGILSPAAKDKVEQEQPVEAKAFKDEAFDQGSCNESTLDSKVSSQRQVNYLLKKWSQTLRSPVFIKSDVPDKDIEAGGLQIHSSRGEIGHNLETDYEKCGIAMHSPDSVESCKGRVEDGAKAEYQDEQRMNESRVGGDVPDLCLDDLMDLDAKPTALVSSDSSAEVPPCGDGSRCYSSLPKCWNDLEPAVDRDDDENFSGCTQPSTITSRATKLHRVGDCRIRKLLASKHRGMAPTISRHGELSNSDVEMKPVFRNRKLCCTRQRTQRSSFKRRKVPERHSISPSEEALCYKGVGNFSEKNIKAEASSPCADLHGANGTFSSVTGQRSPYASDDFHAKLRIKSFKVPELFVEIPESATVGSLKRTVMEAVTTILGGGLRVGILLQGKKVRDDNKTLFQAGIPRDDKLDSLCFTLEPHPKPAPPSVTNPEEPHLLPCDAVQPLAMLPSATLASDPGVHHANLEAPLNPVVNVPESDHDSVQSPMKANSRALVPVPSVSVEALSMVPLWKSKHSEHVQRRIRRPFTVAEVEGLVQAVEMLGTGRWRDVKLKAFHNAKHRTYVDLKDKWKTLVHTARISPHQRRGEPVPQELLDRVLVAHAYWSQQQARLQAKQPPAEVCLLH